MSWATIAEAIRQGIVSGSKLADDHVIWKNQSANQPSVPYVAMSIGAPQSLALDSILTSTAQPWAQSTSYNLGDRVLANGNQYQCATAGMSSSSGAGPSGTNSPVPDGSVEWTYLTPAAGNEVAQQLLAFREVMVEIEVYTGGTGTDPAAGIVPSDSSRNAVDLAEQVRSSMVMPTTRGIMRAVGVSPLPASTAQWVPTIVAAGFRGRATLSIRMNVPPTPLVEFTTYIQQSFQQANATADGGGSISVPYSAP